MRSQLLLSSSLLLVLLPLLPAGCASPQAASRGAEEAAGGLGGLEGEGSSGEGDNSIAISHKQIPEAVIEKNVGTGPRREVNKLRQVLCEGYESQPLIFYHVIISTHWHYYWLCSDYKVRRASTPRGVQRLRSWLEGFKQKAKLLSRDCAAADGQKVLAGNHESGIEAHAACNGQVVLAFPDGSQARHFFTSQAGEAPPSPDAVSPGEQVQVGSQLTCPPCPSCPPPQRCAACPPPRECPPALACPPQRECPAADCKEKMLQAGRLGFKQGVDKACKRICTLIYKKCRSIDPKTALCYQTAEYCAERCPK